MLTGVLAGVNCASVPEGQAGEKAESVANSLLKAAGVDKWQNNTQAVRFVFGPRDNYHFWDKGRDYFEVAWESWLTAYKVQVYKKTGRGIVWVDGKKLDDSKPKEAKKKKKLIKEAYKHFVNDTFWLNPLFHINSPQAIRKYVADKKLLVTFPGGGVTPGDSYVLTYDDEYQLKQVAMWVSIAPVKWNPGMEFSFEDYVETETNVKIATSHRWGLLNIDLLNLKMFSQYPTDHDRFKELDAMLKGQSE